MKGISCKGTTWCALILSILVGFASRAYSDDTIEGTVHLDTHASWTGTGTGDQVDHALDGTHKDDNVYATYSISTIKDSEGKVILDPSKKSTVTIKDTSWGFTTQPIPIKDITADPKTGKVTSFKFKGDDWYDPKTKDADKVVNNGLEGSITFDPKNKDKGTGSLTASYKSEDGKTVQNISFTTTPVKHIQEKKAKDGSPFASDSRINDTKSIDYNARTGILSIHDDTIVRTPAANDPIRGAALTFPDFQFKGLTLDRSLAVFWPIDSTPYIMTHNGTIFEQSTIPFLIYDSTANQFSANLTNTILAGVSPGSPFYDPSLPHISSPFLNSLDSILNSSSPYFDSQANLYIGITPDVNFLALTNNFTSSGLSGANDVEFIADPLPEPATLVLLGIGCCGLLAYGWLHRARRSALPPNERGMVMAKIH